MESVLATQPITITTTNVAQPTKGPIILIRTANGNIISGSLQLESIPLATTTTTTVPTESYQVELPAPTTNDYQMEDILPLTPSTNSESNDDIAANSPESSPDSAYSKMLTNFDVGQFENIFYL